MMLRGARRPAASGGRAAPGGAPPPEGPSVGQPHLRHRARGRHALWRTINGEEACCQIISR
eukprot:5342644-Pyramimonas_sp.AAC.1